ncbi:MAG: hypothetical protein ABJI93_11895 [Nonlabens ulvanivorans]|uniref:hypothetical protein n=1 Tax=Pseudomonadati TaxID=3379134 RepID=UPI00329887E2
MKGIVATGFFRTGSTFFFSCLRETAAFRCYYEPYHPELLSFISDRDGSHSVPDKINLGHSLSDDYHSEFYHLNYRKLQDKFNSIERDINHPILFSNSQHSSLEGYISFLKSEAEICGEIPVYQPNRFNFMLPWLKSKYPDLYLILITRSPFAVYQSLKVLAENSNVNLVADDIKSDFWNVSEIYLLLTSIFTTEFSGKVNFGYYQKLYFIIKFIDFYAGKCAHLIVNYDSLKQDHESIFHFIGKAVNVDMVDSIAYAEQHLNVPKSKPINEYFLQLEEETQPLLTHVKAQCFLKDL